MRTRARKPRRRSSREPAERESPAAPEHGLIDLQSRAGNAAVTGLVARAPAVKDPARLYGWEAVDEAEDLNRAHVLDGVSIRALQAALGTPATGKFTPDDTQALSHLRVRHRLGRGGYLDRPTLNALLRELPAGLENEIVRVIVDFARIDTSTDTLSVRFDPGLTTASAVTFEANTVRRILLGPQALKTYGALLKEIDDQLKPEPPSAFIPALATPSRLSPDAAGAAADANALVLRDRRSALAIQGLLRAPATGVFDEDTSQFIADRQATMGLTKQGGVVDDEFFHHAIKSLNGNADHDALIRLVIDHEQIDESAVIDTGFDPGLDPGRDFLISAAAAGAAMTVRFGPAAFAGQTPEAIVRTITNAYEQAALRVKPASP